MFTVISHPAECLLCSLLPSDGLWLYVCLIVGFIVMRCRIPTERTGRSVRSLALVAGHTSRVTCLEMARRSPILWSGSADGTIRKWDVASGHPGLVIRYLT